MCRLRSTWIELYSALVLLASLFLFSGFAQAQPFKKLAPIPSEKAGHRLATSSTTYLPDTARSGPDYLNSLQMPKGQVQIIQAANEGPITVFIHVSDPKQADYLPCLYWSFDRWAAVTDGRIRFQVVPKLNQAKISILIQPGITFGYDGTLHGDTQYSMKSSGPTIIPLVMMPFASKMRREKMDLKITVNTGPENTSEPLLDRQKRISAVMLHEIGHALGLWGHSPDPDDIMSPTITTARDLTQRDITTIRRLYGLPSHSI